jgi:predicted nucleic-acid-binding Zn-ribbon protein
MPTGTGPHGIHNAKAKPLFDVKPGEWYFGFDCAKCGQRFAVFDDPSKGTINFNGAAHIQVACSHCDHDQLYGADEVQNYKAM